MSILIIINFIKKTLCTLNINNITYISNKTQKYKFILLKKFYIYNK